MLTGAFTPRSLGYKRETPPAVVGAVIRDKRLEHALKTKMKIGKGDRHDYHWKGLCFFSVIKQNLVSKMTPGFSRAGSLPASPRYSEAADIAQAERYWCDTCRNYTPVEVIENEKLFDVRYIQEQCGQLKLKTMEASVVFKNGICARCGGNLAGRMFAVINCEAVCRVVEDIKSFNIGVVAMKLYGKP